MGQAAWVWLLNASSSSSPGKDGFKALVLTLTSMSNIGACRTCLAPALELCT